MISWQSLRYLFPLWAGLGQASGRTSTRIQGPVISAPGPLNCPVRYGQRKHILSGHRRRGRTWWQDRCAAGVTDVVRHFNWVPEHNTIKCVFIAQKPNVRTAQQWLACWWLLLTPWDMSCYVSQCSEGSRVRMMRSCKYHGESSWTTNCTLTSLLKAFLVKPQKNLNPDKYMFILISVENKCVNISINLWF